MGVSWIFALGAVAGALLGVVAMIGLAARRAGRAQKFERKQWIDEASQIRAAVTELQAQMAGRITASAEPGINAFVSAPALTADQRAGALQMLRSGADTGTVCGALRLSHPETVLLQKVQRLLDSTTLTN
jgi:hypothetical protein